MFSENDYGTPTQKKFILKVNQEMEDFCINTLLSGRKKHILGTTHPSEDSSGPAEAALSFESYYLNQSELSFQLKDWLFNLTKQNMEELYAKSNDGWNHLKKRAELVGIPDSHYILIRLKPKTGSFPSSSAAPTSLQTLGHPFGESPSSASAAAAAAAAANLSRPMTASSRARVFGLEGPHAGFAQFRIIVENEEIVLYLYDIQIEQQYQRFGLGSVLVEV